VYLTGKYEAVLTLEIDLEQLNTGDTSELYTSIADAFTDNDWEDLVLNSVDFQGGEAECYVTAF